MARPNPLADPAYAREVAQAFADGQSRKQMCLTFGVKDEDTITRWRRDPRVKAIAFKLIEDRVLQITRKVDGKIAAILENNDLTVKELLDIRKEFLGGQLREQTQKADSNTVAEAHRLLEDDPALADELEKLLSRGTLPDSVAAAADAE